MEKLGPNVRRLIAHKMSLDAIPPGTKEPLADGANFLLSKQRLLSSVNAATDWVKEALKSIREAADPNPWQNADEEAIAKYLLDQIAERQQRRTDELKNQ